MFAVTQEDPYKPLALFRTQVDMLFSFIAEPASSSARGLENSIATLRGGSKHAEATAETTYNEDDDYELQQALQASLSGSDHIHIGSFTPPQSGDILRPTISPDPSTPTSEVDPVAVSMERNRFLLQQMREQQEFAQRELWSEAASELSPEERAAQENRRAVLRQQEEEEERELRRAIEESEALARQHTEQMERPRFYDQGPQASLQVPYARRTPTPGLTDPDSDSEEDEPKKSDAPRVHEEPAQNEPTVEEIRQARLARFA